MFIVSPECTGRMTPGFSGAPVFSKKGYAGLIAAAHYVRVPVPFAMDGNVTMNGNTSAASLDGNAKIGITSAILVNADTVQACLQHADTFMHLPTLDDCADHHFHAYKTRLGVHQSP